MNETIQHLVLVRHGEGEGDVRRAAWKRGETVEVTKKPEDEELTVTGAEQSRQAGLWIAKHIIERFGLRNFDVCLTSATLRSEQSAAAMDLDIAVWQEDYCLNERDRGLIRGLTAQEHRERYPESYRQMHVDPLHWQPPGGESIEQVAKRVRECLENIDGLRTILAETHRDLLWAAMQPLEGLSEAEMLAVNTDEIHPAQIIHYTSLNPETGEQAPALMWKRSVDPMQPEASAGWQTLPHLAEQYGYEALPAPISLRRPYQ